MTIKSPTSVQDESIEYVFKTHNQHVKNVVDWLNEARDASIQLVLHSPPELTERAIGMANALEGILGAIRKHYK